ncbi:MAG: hypothetical protein IJ474_02790, partial [Mailhella sp.]|nr:hypothetical protein [Mailhella sp.]
LWAISFRGNVPCGVCPPADFVLWNNDCHNGDESGGALWLAGDAAIVHLADITNILAMRS